MKPAQTKTTVNVYGGSLGGSSFCVGNNKTQQEGKQDGAIEVNSDKISKVGVKVNFDALLLEELIARLKNARVSANTQDSASKRGNSKTHSTSFDNEESMSQSSSSSSDSSAESSEGVENGAGSR